MLAYFKNIIRGITTTFKGMKATFRHLRKARISRKNHQIDDSGYFDSDFGRVTLQYPHETMPVPDIGRYQLDCEIDDCIVCDKCAKVCPVDCIEIEAIKSPELISYASDGSPIRLYAAKFDIDMAKCCFCGLCTTVCPTECLTMTSEYDFSTLDVREMNFQFSNLSPEQAESKRQLYEQFVAEKEAAKPLKTEVSAEKPTSKPSFKPTFKPVTKVEEIVEEAPQPKPVFKPKMKATVAENVEEKVTVETHAEEPSTPQPKPIFKPKMKATVIENIEEKTNIETPIEETSTPQPKPIFKPKMKATVIENIEEKINVETPAEETSTPRPKPVYKPKMKIKPD